MCPVLMDRASEYVNRNFRQCRISQSGMSHTKFQLVFTLIMKFAMRTSNLGSHSSPSRHVGELGIAPFIYTISVMWR